jgi:TldD protein
MMALRNPLQAALNAVFIAATFVVAFVAAFVATTLAVSFVASLATSTETRAQAPVPAQAPVREGAPVLAPTLSPSDLLKPASVLSSIVLNAMKTELRRSMDALKREPNPPYFIAYTITEVRSWTISSSFGQTQYNDSARTRTLDVEVRVGNYDLDSKRQIRGASFEMGGFQRGYAIPLDDDKSIGNDADDENSENSAAANSAARAIRAVLWAATDKQYKAAAERYLKVVSNRAVKVKEEDGSGDFSHEAPALYREPIATMNVDTKAWKARLNRLSALFANDPKLYDGEVSFRGEVITKYIVTSEGTEIRTSEPFVRVFAQARTKADDGMTLPLYRSYFAFSPDEITPEASIRADVEDMMNILAKLRTAPLMETYSGPAMLSGEAAGVFFHEIFGHRIEGHRQKDVNSSQTFKNLIGEKVLPDFMDVVFDPTIRQLRTDGTRTNDSRTNDSRADGSRAGAALQSTQSVAGHYKYDDEGVLGKRVVAVKNGVFREFLMSRSPVEKFPQSNGHGRKQPNFAPVARQSNLLVQASRTVSFDTLRAMLRRECKRQNKDYGLYFVEIQGGFTFTNRTVPNAFNVLPLVVYKIFTDGRPDELVRGVDLIGTPLTTFRTIEAAATDLGVFNGICGAESGGVPVSASSPSLFVSLIEAQKKAKSQAKLPLLPSPVPARTATGAGQ